MNFKSAITIIFITLILATISYAGTYSDNIDGIGWFNGTNLNVSDVRQDLNFNNKNISQIELVNGVNFTDKIREPETYKLFNDSGTIKVLNASGQLNYSGTNLSILLNNINTTMPANSTINFYSGEYNLTGEVKFDKNVNLVCEGLCVISSSLPGVDAINISGRTKTTVNLDADIIIGAAKLYVSDASQVSIGDLIIVYDDILWNPADYANLKTGEIHEVMDVSGTMVLVRDSFINNYSTSANGKVSIILAPTATVNGDFVFDGVDRFSSTRRILRFKNTKDSIIDGATFKNAGYFGVAVEDSYNTNIKGKFYDNMNSGLGYGVAVWDTSAYTSIYGSVFKNNRHGVTIGGFADIGESRDTVVKDSVFLESNVDTSTAQAVDAHPMVESLTVTGNTIYNSVNNSDYAVYAGSRVLKVNDNMIYEGTGIGLRESTSNRIIYIENNILHNSTFIYRYGDGTTDNVTYAKVCGNTLIGNRVTGIDLRDVEYAEICNNLIKDTGIGDGGTAINLDTLSGGKVFSNTIISPFTHGIAATNVNNTKFKDNDILNLNYRNANNRGIYLINSMNNTIQENYIETAIAMTNGRLIEIIENSGERSGNNSIEGNVFNMTTGTYARATNVTQHDVLKNNRGLGNNTYMDYEIPLCDKSLINRTRAYCWNQTSQATNVFNGTRWLWSGNGTEVI